MGICERGIVVMRRDEEGEKDWLADDQKIGGSERLYRACYNYQLEKRLHFYARDFK